MPQTRNVSSDTVDLQIQHKNTEKRVTQRDLGYQKYPEIKSRLRYQHQKLETCRDFEHNLIANLSYRHEKFLDCQRVR